MHKYNYVVYPQVLHSLKVISDYLVVQTLGRAELKSICQVLGALLMMIHGLHKMHKLFADSWATGLEVCSHYCRKSI